MSKRNAGPPWKAVAARGELLCPRRHIGPIYLAACPRTRAINRQRYYFFFFFAAFFFAGFFAAFFFATFFFTGFFATFFFAAFFFAAMATSPPYSLRATMRRVGWYAMRPSSPPDGATESSRFLAEVS